MHCTPKAIHGLSQELQGGAYRRCHSIRGLIRGRLSSLSSIDAPRPTTSADLNQLIQSANTHRNEAGKEQRKT